ncbi:MAG TPA: diguanylate cyclase [Terracidiphilus sp.]|nr:diguanylate cyclase [Terracidiphilus sp.]
MLGDDRATILIASNDAVLIRALKPILSIAGASIEIAPSTEASQRALTGTNPPSLAFLDAEMEGMCVGRQLAAARDHETAPRVSLVLLSPDVTEEWTAWAREGLLDDVIPRQIETLQGRLRLAVALRSWRRSREGAQSNATDPQNLSPHALTRVDSRSTLLSLFFRETDRAQRMKTPLSLLLLAIDDFAHWNMRLGTAASNDLLHAVAERTMRLLRSYDLLGPAGAYEILIILPGCTMANAMMLAERLRIDVFGPPVSIGPESVRLTACFGIASSEGRSPMVVLREAESALQRARDAGPDAIECFANRFEDDPDPAAFLHSGFDDQKSPR